MRIVGIEEHFNLDALAHYSAAAEKNLEPRFWREASERLGDLTDRRISDMDRHGVAVQVVSLTSPGVQAELDPVAAVRAARLANDHLAEMVGKAPERLAGFAAAPTVDPTAAAHEVRRTVGESGVKGVLVNGHSGGRYLDEPDYHPFWEAVVEADVPVYLHPANAYRLPHVLEGHPVLAGPAWGWGVDAASHALRLVFSGLFDRFPSATVILGHMGEGLPYWTTRLDSRYAVARKQGHELRRRPSDYIRDNFYVTTSGVCHSPALRCAVDTVGADRVLFSTDYPMEDLGEAVEFLRTANLDDTERELVAHRNADRLLRLTSAAKA